MPDSFSIPFARQTGSEGRRAPLSDRAAMRNQHANPGHVRDAGAPLSGPEDLSSLYEIHPMR